MRQPIPQDTPPRIVVLGDLMLDRYTWGDVRRISPEAPVPVLTSDLEEVRPGGAASLAHIAHSLGARVEVVGVVGDDAHGRTLKNILQSEHVAVDSIVVDADRPTTVKHRFLGRAAGRHVQQLFRVDQEVTTPIPERLAARLLEEIDAALLRADCLLISDYAKGTCHPLLVRAAIDMARHRGLPVIVDPACSAAPSAYAGASIVKPNRVEAAALAGRSRLSTVAEAQEVAPRIVAHGQVEAVVVTLDCDGIVVCDGQGVVTHCPTRSRVVYDVAGAGDTVTAVLGLAAAYRWPLIDAAAVANAAAGYQVEQIGVAPVRWSDFAVSDIVTSDSDSKIRSLDQLVGDVHAARAAGERIVLTNGCFDLLHAGHLALLKEAARQGDRLIVAINSDKSVRRLKGNGRPVVQAQERAALLAGLDCVFRVLIFEDDTPHKVIDRLRPDVLVKGGTTGDIVGKELVESYGGHVVRTTALPGYSTTGRLRQIGSFVQSMVSEELRT